MTRHVVDTEALTVIAIDIDGTRTDLNRNGDRCESLHELAQYVRMLHRLGFVSDDDLDMMISHIRRQSRLRVAEAAGEPSKRWTHATPGKAEASGGT